jgi:flavin-dependent thymidylate synthase
MAEIKFVKPEVRNFRLIDGGDAWKEVVYSARMSGVPPEVKDEDVFRMLVANNYMSAVEHVIIKFDVRMSKGNAPEFLEHRMMSHSGYSTRYIEVSQGLGKTEPAYEIIAPFHLLGEEQKKDVKDTMSSSFNESIKAYTTVLSKGTPREIARYVLPFGQAVGIYHVTINLRSLLNLLSLRLCVRSSPEFRCIAAQIYLNLVKELPQLASLVGCRGFMSGACPESNVTGVRTGTQHPFYPVCLYKSPDSEFFIPTIREERRGLTIKAFDKDKASEAQRKIFVKWASWE